MKKYIVSLIGVICFNLTSGQTLYTENFNSYPVGNVGTDITGTVSGNGGWYTKSIIGGFSPDPAAGANTDYQIVAEPTMGNVVEITPMGLVGDWQRFLYRNDLKFYWQQRTPG